MKELKKLLEKSGVKRALVVDDAFDTIPLASDMTVDVEAWTRFFADITANDHEVLEEVYIGYNDTNADELTERDNFTKTVWTARARLSKGPVDTLFARFESDRKMDLSFASALLSVALAAVRDATLEDVGADAPDDAIRDHQMFPSLANGFSTNEQESESLLTNPSPSSRASRFERFSLSASWSTKFCLTKCAPSASPMTMP